MHRSLPSLIRQTPYPLLVDGKEVAAEPSANFSSLNHGAGASVDAPFGGHKESRIGKEHGIPAMLDDTQVKNVRYTIQ
jgi:acyl-CoA reductase-like NAD-dependent aldehyde dehydrogenase